MELNYKTLKSNSIIGGLVLAFAFLAGDASGSSWTAPALQESPPTVDKLNKYQKHPEGRKAAPKDKRATDPKQDDKSADKSTSSETKSNADENNRRSSRRPRRSRTRANSTRSEAFLQVFHPVILETARSTVEVQKNGKTIALGAIVDAAGYVLTKHSELSSPLTCELNDGRVVPAYVYGVHAKSDLALLKIEAANVPAVQWANDSSLEVGHWLATVKDNDQPLAIGIVGVNARLIKPQSGFMGVNLRDTDSGVQITEVTPDSPAQDGGLKPRDVILKVNSESFSKIEKLIPFVKGFPPGEEIRLTLMRNDREIVLDIVLGEERSLNPLFERSNQQNTMGGNLLSNRRQDFPLAVQHDTVLKPHECGGPVVNIDGQVVGINIARQGRVASLMLPTSLVVPLVEELKSGQLAPAVVNKDRIDEINRTLQSLNTIKSLSPVNSDSLQQKVRKLTNEEKELRKQLETALRERIRAELALERATRELKDADSEIERLQKEREKLVTGTK